jgi:hypothetical protein
LPAILFSLAGNVFIILSYAMISKSIREFA